MKIVPKRKRAQPVNDPVRPLAHQAPEFWNIGPIALAPGIDTIAQLPEPEAVWASKIIAAWQEQQRDPFSKLRNACWHVRGARPGMELHAMACVELEREVRVLMGHGIPLAQILGMIARYLVE